MRHSAQLADALRLRLVYNYVMLDQELSLFHDTAPFFSITELQCPLPGHEVLWMAPNSEQWFLAVKSVYGCTVNVNPQLLTAQPATPSLFELFQEFLQEKIPRRGSDLTPQQLRLLLHPLQSLLGQLRQLLSCFPHAATVHPPAPCVLTRESALARLEEGKALLRKWYDLTLFYGKTNPNCPVTRSNLVVYHLVSLNAVTDFPEIERLARREGLGHNPWDLSLRYRRCIFSRGEALLHSGQVFRLLRLMPNDRRPAWWSAAVYRAALVLWTESVCALVSGYQNREQRDGAAAVVAEFSRPQMPMSVPIDQREPEDPELATCIWNGMSAPALTMLDGSTVTLDRPSDVLLYAVRTIEAGFSSRLGDGIRRKLTELDKNWEGDILES